MTSQHKVLIDTNVFIGLEDPKPVSPAGAELVRKCGEHAVALFIHQAAILDIQQDADAARRTISLSKLEKFQNLPRPVLPPRADLERDFGPIKKRNDEVDVELLHTLRLNAVDLLITEDKGIHDRAKRAGLAARVLTVADALSWLRRTFEPAKVRLPYIEDRLAHEIDPSDTIFESLREGYPEFDAWWAKCIKQHRSCWVVTIGDQMAGLIVRKDETATAAGTRLPGAKVLKICTFKVRPEYRGEKLGELLLKQALWFAQRNAYDVVYLTTFADQTTLIRVIEYFGFICTDTKENGEFTFEKMMSRARLEPDDASDLFQLDRVNYPRFIAGSPAKAFFVPIQGAFHRILFPEIARAIPLPLFPGEDVLHATDERKPGNTIRKVYLSHSNTRTLAPGDVLVFYHSKDEAMVASQCVTSIGLVEKIAETTSFEELVRLTAKRSVYSEGELREMIKAPILVIDFLLIGHLDAPVALDDLLKEGVFKTHPPQSLCELPPERFEPIRRRLDFGFEV
ncbi:MAG: GNAT family N-acetyltransferase [Alphaproteobacteria bacterium]|nr:MAG: GNAT family N-acetyltransferase [Alphaproteobacteria bacterium]